MTDAAIKRTRLFSMLIVEHYRSLQTVPAYGYLKFLRGERRQHKCYPIAIRAIVSAS